MKLRQYNETKQTPGNLFQEDFHNTTIFQGPAATEVTQLRSTIYPANIEQAKGPHDFNRTIFRPRESSFEGPCATNFTDLWPTIYPANVEQAKSFHDFNRTIYRPNTFGEFLETFHPAVLKYAGIIQHMGKKYNVPPQIIGNIVLAESWGDSNAFVGSGENSYGLMQITEATARDMGYKGPMNELFNPEANIELGTKLLSMYRDMEWPLFTPNTPLVDRWMIIASAYNQGPLYGLEALRKVKASGRITSWDNVFNHWSTYPLPSGPKRGKRPLYDYSRQYGPKIVFGYNIKNHLSGHLPTAQGVRTTVGDIYELENYLSGYIKSNLMPILIGLGILSAVGLSAFLILRKRVKKNPYDGYVHYDDEDEVKKK